jgi:U3 small nucleolar RNA-associated protein 20
VVIAQLLLQFMLEYPLGTKRLLRHIDFILKNLAYSLETGREAALGMLNAIVAKFPAEVLMQHVEYIFIAVVVSTSTLRGDVRSLYCSVSEQFCE